MKKKTIWTIATIMGLSFLALLFLQIKYIDEMVRMKKEQFDESVNRSLYQASRNLELNETLRFLEKDVNAANRKAHNDAVEADSAAVGSILPDNDTNSFENQMRRNDPASMPKVMILSNDKTRSHRPVSR